MSRRSMSFLSKRSREFFLENRRARSEQMVRGREAANCSPAAADQTFPTSMRDEETQQLSFAQERQDSQIASTNAP